MYHYKIFVKYYCAGKTDREIKPIWKNYPNPFNEQTQLQLEEDLVTRECFCEVESIEFLGKSDELYYPTPTYQQPINSIIATHNSSCANSELSTGTCG